MSKNEISLAFRIILKEKVKIYRLWKKDQGEG